MILDILLFIDLVPFMALFFKFAAKVRKKNQLHKDLYKKIFFICICQKKAVNLHPIWKKHLFYDKSSISRWLYSGVRMGGR